MCLCWDASITKHLNTLNRTVVHLNLTDAFFNSYLLSTPQKVQITQCFTVVYFKIVQGSFAKSRLQEDSLNSKCESFVNWFHIFVL